MCTACIILCSSLQFCTILCTTIYFCCLPLPCIFICINIPPQNFKYSNITNTKIFNHNRTEQNILRAQSKTNYLHNYSAQLFIEYRKYDMLQNRMSSRNKVLYLTAHTCSILKKNVQNILLLPC